MSEPQGNPTEEKHGMDPKTLRALRGSIRKWERIAAGVGEDHGTDNCPLCALFREGDCEGCPVAKETGRIGCDGTPYDRFSKISDNALFFRGWRMRRQAQRELTFLRLLLPIGVDK